MSKKVISKIAALGLAGVSALSVMSVSASALETTTNLTTGTTTATGNVWKVTTSAGGTTTIAYYATQAQAKTAAGASGTVASVSLGSCVSYGSKFNINPDGKIVLSSTGTYTAASTSPSYSDDTTSKYYIPYKYASNLGISYQGSNGVWYPNLSSLYAAGTTLANKVATDYSYELAKQTSQDGYVYFNPANGQYSSVKENDDFVIIYGVSSSYNEYYYNDYDSYDVYKVGSYYYPTLSAALSAAGNDYSKITKYKDYSKPASNYFSQVTGQYYPTYEAALAASGNKSSLVTTFSGYSYYYGDTYDPYYYYYLNKYGYYWGNNTYKVEKGDATLHSNSKKGGWKYLQDYLKSAKSGASVGIDMNDQTTLPKEILSAIKGKNIDIVLYMDNGAVFTINGKDVSSAKDVRIGVEYNTDYVPSKLVKAAYKKNKAVSSAQLSLDSSSFGFEADVTVKFSAKRADYTAKLYRYNSSKGTLVLVDSSTIKDNGKCTFNNVSQGGNFVVVIC